jgi:FkbM family methyltransferase
MSFSNKIIRYIYKRRSIRQKNNKGPLGQFYRDGGNEILFKYLTLDNNSVVIDGGCYLGDFTKEILIRFGSRVLSFEPLKKEYKQLVFRFEKNKLVNLYNQAIYDSEKKIPITLDGLNSSIFSNIKIKKKKLFIKTFDIANIFKKYKKIDLLKLNVEGTEYKILLRLIKKKKLNNIDGYLIQFHPISDSQIDIKKIRKSFLQQGFKQIFNYNYVWEYWSK